MEKEMPQLVFDYDFIKFAAACLAEERTIKVVHKQSGREKFFQTRTDFYGNWHKKNGGWLSEQNKKRTTPFLVEDFEIFDLQTPKPKSHAIQCAKTQIESILHKVEADSYYGFVGKGKSFREDLSTILKYKGTREGLLRPIYLDDVAEYIVKNHNGEYQEHSEVDDRVVQEWHRDKSLTVVGGEKDFMGCEINFFNPSTMDTPMKIRGLGGLYIDAKKKVRGHGRMFKYHQCLSSDSADNYAANSASDVKWGEKSSYNLLAPCKTDKECFEALVKGYKTLYPEPKMITGWRGNKIEVDWLYVLNENLNLAHLHRWENDFINTKAVLDKLGITY